jgi:hypothetical protein
MEKRGDCYYVLAYLARMPSAPTHARAQLLTTWRAYEVV